jgi:hypothetical protein
MRLALGLAFVAAAVLTGAAASAPPAPVPGYLSDDLGTLGLASNAAMSGAKIVGTGSQVTLFAKKKPELWAPIWAKSCSAGAQTVTFTREVWLPGPPNISGSFSFVPYLGSSMAGALSTLDLVVNGKVVAHRHVPAAHTQTSIPIDASAAKAFRYEENTIQVRVHKKATAGACNRSAVTQVAIEFFLQGHIGTDLGENPGRDEFRKLAPNQSYTQGFNVSFKNNGPAGVAKGIFHLTVCCTPKFLLGSSATAATGVAPPAPPLTDCKETDSGTSHTVDCGIANMAPGTSGILGAVFEVVGPPGDYSDFSVSIGWQVVSTGVQDTNTANNTSGIRIYFCGTKSTNPGCKTAS